VQHFAAHPAGAPLRGIGPGDCPAFVGMHDASAAVAGGSLTAVARVLNGSVEHAFHPGGGLHHAMAGYASGFCIYNDVALAVAAARDAGHRVLYVDLDVHHGDGVEAVFWDDPQVLTCSFHETGETLFPGSGAVEDRGGHLAPGRAVNVPLQPGTGDASWLEGVQRVVPAIAEVFRPTFLVTQHGCDTHAFDPLAHLRLTTAAYAQAATLMHDLAHRHADGRWLATGGGGYDAYRVVPRAWGLVWLAQAHAAVPGVTPEAWRARWAAEAARYGQGPPPIDMVDPPGTVGSESPTVAARNARTLAQVLDATLELLAAG